MFDWLNKEENVFLTNKHVWIVSNKFVFLFFSFFMSSQSDNLYLKLDRSSIKSESNSGTNLFEEYNLVNELAKAKTKVFWKYV